MKFFALITGCVCTLALPSSAQVLMLDFGFTSVDLASQAKSPYHTVNTAFTDGTWNKVELTDFSAGSLKWSDNTTATGLSLNLGQNATTTGAGILDLSTQPTRSLALGGSITAGVYAGNVAGKDGILPDGTSADNRAIGFQIGGLSAGTYDIYLTGRNTNISTAYRMKFYAGASGTSGNFDFSGYSSGLTTYTNGATNQTAAWVAGDNYVKLSVTLTSGEFLNIASLGVDSAELRGFLNSVQIVNTSPIPEPASVALIAGLVALAGVAGLRRRR